ncbi:MAG: glycosyltransferase family 39 protein [Gemmatales bacterium]|nr:glycosyltransferase family 39 protein [Gemmatales bacterium]
MNDSAWYCSDFRVEAGASREGLGDSSYPSRTRNCGLGWECLLLASMAAAAYLAGADRYDLLTDDEIRYAEAGRQMLRRGDWIVPVYNGEPRYQKPLLVYWLQALSQACFGSNAFAARIPSAVAAAVTLWATGNIARTMWDHATARWTILILATMFEFVLLARMVLIDMILVACLQVSHAAWLSAWCSTNDRRRTWWYRLSSFALGGAICAKGPIALVLFAFLLIPWLVLVPWLRKRSALPSDADTRTDGHASPSWRPVPIVSGIVLAALLGLPSYLLPHWRTAGQFTWQFLLTENWQRLTSVVNEHPQPWWFYLALLVPMSFPWTGAIASAVSLAWHSRTGAQDWRGLFPLVLLGHIILIFTFFTLSQTKVWTYTFPAFPSLALLIAYWLVQMQQNQPRLLLRRFRQALGFGTWPVIAAVWAFTFWPESRLPEEVRVPEFLSAVRWWSWCLALMLLAGWLVSLVLTNPRTILAYLVVGTLTLYALAVFHVLPAADRMWNEPVRQVADYWQRYPEAEVVTYHVHELGLNFLARRDLVHHWRREALSDLYERLQNPAPVLVLADTRLVHHLHGLPIHIWHKNNRFVLLANFSPPQVQTD